jgi:hypothetical protein
VVVRRLAIVVTAFACAAPPPEGAAGLDGDGNGSSGPPAESAYPTALVLHEKAIAPTCAPNDGVCHNSKEYPDLHTLSNLVAILGAPCNAGAPSHGDVHDACEPTGDRLVVRSAAIDAEIARVELFPADATTDDLTAVTVWLAGDGAVTIPAGASDVEVHRGELVFAVGAGGVSVTGVEGRAVSLDLGPSDSARRFFDDRSYPWDPTIVRVADVNANGVLGRTLGVSLAAVGDPAASYLVLRLMDASYGDLMPRQCRTWNDQATRALGCWLAGLDVDDEGRPTNADAPIDYASCDFDPLGLGRCGAGDVVGTGFDSVESIFARACGGSGCHIDEDDPPVGLDLSAGRARASLVGVASDEVPDLMRVAPGAPEDSYLLCKLDTECARRVGDRMPVGGMLTAEEIAAIAAWIAAGAE